MNVIQDLTKNKTVAVIGSSDNLKKRNGVLIDGHEVIIRFNLAFPVSSTHLGTKTTILACNCHVSKAILKENLNKYFTHIKKGYGKKVLNYYKKQNPQYICRRSEPVDGIDSKKRVAYISADALDYCNNVVQNLSKQFKNLSGHKLKRQPRLGFHMVCILVDNGVVPSIFGMDISNPSHKKFYAESRFAKRECHDIESECKILSLFVKNKLVKNYC